MPSSVDGIRLLGHIVQSIKACIAAHSVDSLESSGGDEPRPRIIRHAVARPLLERGSEGVVQRFFGDVEVTEQANKGSENAARFGAVDSIDDLAPVVAGFFNHGGA